MIYTSCMASDTEFDHSRFKQELDALQASYGSASFIRSVLQVYARDCPEAIKSLKAAIAAGSLEETRNKLHSLSNILGVVGPVSGYRLIDVLSLEVKAGRLEAAGRLAEELELLVGGALIAIDEWLEDESRGTSPGKITPGESVL